MRGKAQPDDLGTAAGRVLQPHLAASGGVLALFEVQVAPVGSEPAVPVDEEVVRVLGVLQIQEYN